MANGFINAGRLDAIEVEEGFDLRETLSFVWRQWKFIAAITIIVFLVGTVFLLRETPLYTATSQILLDRQRQKPPGGDAILADTNFDIAMVESQIAIIQSTVFLRRVVDKEHLAAESVVVGGVSPGRSTEGPSFFDSAFSYLLSLVGSSWAEQTKPETELAPVPVGSDSIPPNELRAIQALKGSLKVSREAQQGYVLTISDSSPDPVRAARLANAVADAYLVDMLDTRFEAAKRASAWLSDRLLGLQKQLRESEEAVEQFRAEHGFVRAGGGTLNQQQLSELNAKLIDARADLAQKKTRVDLLNSVQAKGGSLQSLTDVGSAGALPALRQQLANLSAQEAATGRHTRWSQAQMRDVERSIGGETQRLAASVRSEYELGQARVASLEKSLQAATGQTNLDDTTAIRLREIERTAAVNKTLFEDFLKQARFTQEQSTFEPQGVRVITPALPPGEPSYPRKTQFMAINLLIGLLLGVGGALTKERLNTGFTTPKQIEDMLGLPALTSVSHLTGRDLTVGKSVVSIHDFPIAKPLSRYSEAIRSLRSGIQMTDIDHPPKVIQVTSAVPGEGKTTVSLALAASAASAKLKVLFIDANLRHPTATRVFGLQKEPGLVDLLMGEVGVEDVIRFYEKGGYWTLGGGNKTQNSSDLLGSERMNAMVASFKETYDLVVIDTPPTGPVLDPVVVSRLSDKIILIVRWGVTARELVKECVNQLSGHRKIAGVAFNQVNDRQAQKYGKYAYSYYASRYYKSYYS
jgi:succinoglycan biosynthesis transport protein ExoP